MNDLEIALIKYNGKTWCKSAFLGFLIGLAVIVPGISGSTVAIIFKLYNAIVTALANFFKAFKRCVIFLLPIAVGIVLGLLLGFITVQKLLEIIPFATVGLFAGLMCGAFPAVKDELKGEKPTCLKIVLTFLGIALPVVIGIISVFAKDNDSAFTVDATRVILSLPLGYLLGITQIVPGLSASAILMSIGWFTPLVESVGFDNWINHPEIFLVYFGLGIGLLLALFTFSKLLAKLFERARGLTYCVIVGLSLGSILTMFFNPEIFETYSAWKTSGVNVLDLCLGVGLFAVGCVCAYMLVRYERKKKISETVEIQKGE